MHLETPEKETGNVVRRLFLESWRATAGERAEKNITDRRPEVIDTES
jgi:hypothetical protein